MHEWMTATKQLLHSRQHRMKNYIIYAFHEVMKHVFPLNLNEMVEQMNKVHIYFLCFDWNVCFAFSVSIQNVSISNLLLCLSLWRLTKKKWRVVSCLPKRMMVNFSLIIFRYLFLALSIQIRYALPNSLSNNLLIQ